MHSGSHGRSRSNQASSAYPSDHQPINTSGKSRASPIARRSAAQDRRLLVRKNDRVTPPLSAFRTCLVSVSVPPKILIGIKVTKVNSNGKTKGAFLTLSEDKFTLYITTTQIKNDKGSNGVFRPIIRRVASIGSSHGDEHEYERTIDVGSIVRIQKGQHTLRFELCRKQLGKISSPKRRKPDGTPKLNPDKCFSIFFVGGRTVDLIISDDEADRDEVVAALERLMEEYAKAKLNVVDYVILLRYIWLDVDKDKSNSINQVEFSLVLNRINYTLNRAKSNETYNKFTSLIRLSKAQRRHGLSFEQCSTILHRVKRDSSWSAKPARQIFFETFGEFMNNGKQRDNVSADSFLRKFMLKKQGESNTTMEDVEKIFRSLNKLEVADVASNYNLDDAAKGKYIDIDRFEAYLKIAENDVFDPAKEVLDRESMNRPISEFWVHSSHNTYLSGDQWKSMSSVEMYMEALYRGCRCLELDCWDGERDAEQTPIPDIFHGHTITSRIPFRDVILGIKVFLNGCPDCYPIILSLENHCSIPFQETMARCMVEIFADSLFIPDEASLQDSIPSAEMLKGKVVLKGQRITDSKDGEYNDYNTEFESDSDDSEIGDQYSSKDDVPLTPKPPRLKTSPELSRITYLHSVNVKTFQESLDSPPFHMHSFNESRTRRYSRRNDERENWISYNRTHITRTYPSPKRVGSSNYNPIAAWSAGCQLVAINLQTRDYARLLNDGRFRENGGYGYVLKPPSINGGDTSPPQPFVIYVKVLAGYCLPKPRGKKRGDCIDPFVHVCLYDISFNGGKEIVTGQFTEKVKPKNGFNPVWIGTEAFKWKVQNPDVAMLQLTVWDKDMGNDDFIASSSIPISCIREGYRGVKLFDSNHTRSGPFECASLLIEVRVKKGEDVMMW